MSPFFFHSNSREKILLKHLQISSCQFYKFASTREISPQKVTNRAIKRHQYEEIVQEIEF